MRKFNRKLNKDINHLKKLHAKKDKTDFKRMKAEIMKRYKLSKATVYRELKKDTPGLYKTPNYYTLWRPVTTQEVRMVRELLTKQVTVSDAAKIMERETGQNYNWDRIDKIRKMIDLPAPRLRQACASAREGTNHPVPPTGGPPLLKTGGELGTAGGEPESCETAFGEDIKNLLMNIYKLDKMAEGSYVTLKAGDKIIPIDYHTIKDIITLIANCYDAEKGDVIELTRIRTFHLIAEKVRLAAKGQYASIHDLSDITNILRRYEKSGASAFSPDYRVMLGVIKELKPDASYLEIFELAEKHQKLIKHSTEDIVPDITPIKRMIQKEAEKRM